MAKYSERASEKVGRALHEEKMGELKTGSGKKVTSRKQAIAIGLSEARKEGGKSTSAPKDYRKKEDARNPQKICFACPCVKSNIYSGLGYRE
ncbi:MAG: DUF6496 domain-containing protein [Chitinophagaceae bacterium]